MQRIEGTDLGVHNNPAGGDGVRVARPGPALVRRPVVGGPTGAVLTVPDARHSLHALTDSAILPTVAKLP
jgi:hypothetical protein